MVTDRIDNPFASRRAEGAGQTPAPPAVARANGSSAHTPAPADPRRPPAAARCRAMTGYEEEVIERRLRDPNTAALCNEIVARCLVAPGADHTAAYEQVRSMSTVERDLCLVEIRRRSLGDVVELEVACPACGKKNDVDFALGALPLDVRPGKVTDVVDVRLPDGTHASARIPTAGDQEDLLQAGLASESERRTFLIGRVLLRHGEQAGPFDAAFVRALPIGARAAIERALEAAIPDLDLSMAVRCADCGAEFSTPFDVPAFFLPR